MIRRSLRRSVLALSALLVASEAARATWSIVVVDTRTREVCVASATCIGNFPLKNKLPVIVVGTGAAAAQSLVDQNGQNRLRIRNGLLAGETPAQIQAALFAQDPTPNQRQYGIVSLEHGPLTWTGTNVGNAWHGVTGSVGDLHYAIQGNVLTGAAVVDAAEAALLMAQGDLAQRVMAGMEAAAALGGDGRCSCAPFNPTACGVPPPMFQYSAYTSFIVLGRVGDTDGTCAAPGCANGSYWLDLAVISNQNGPEPIVELRAQFEAWRQSMALVPDGLLTEVEVLADSIVADGRSQTAVLIHPKNLDGQPISVNGLIGVDVVPLDPGPPSAIPGPSWWHGAGPDGVFGFALRATDVPGTARFALTLRQHNRRIRLWPDLEVRVDPASELHVGRDELSAQQGGRVPLTLGFGPGEAGRPYVLAASASGTSPGTPFGSAVLPVNTDSLFVMVQQSLGSARLPGFVGALDADGRASAELLATPGLLNAWIGRRIDLAVGLSGAPERVGGPAGFVVVP